MKKLGLILSLLATLALPATALAQHGHGRGASHGHGKAKAKAARYCKGLREDLGVVAFRATFAQGAKGRSAFGKCVKARAAKSLGPVVGAVRTCRQERETDEEDFSARYGTNHNLQNAFGKCVSSQAGEEDDEGDNQGDDEVDDQGDDPGDDVAGDDDPADESEPAES